MAKAETLGEFYYDNKAASYWLQLVAGRFVEMDSRNVKLHMRWNGIPVDKEDEKTLLKVGDELLLKCQKYRGIDYAGPLAGHSTGLQKVGPKSVLVTSQITPIAAVRGSIENFDRFLAELLRDAASHFLYWLKMARESLIAGDFRPGQMPVLAGPSGCGKSFLQTLITQFLGGRMAKPYRYMTGGTQFNSDLAAAEHWVIADEQADINITARRKFGATTKDATVNPEMSVHAKGREAITLQTFRRVSLSCNDEPENLAILPPLDDSILDKLMLFRCFPARLGKNRKAIWNRFYNELPALAWHLDRMTIPKEFADDRYGVKAYHDDELLTAVMGISPEQRLLDLIDETLWKRKESRDKTLGDVGEWEGSAIELERVLRQSDFAAVVDKLLHYSSACGVYLQRLALKLPNRITKTKNAGKTYWRILKG